MRRDLSSQRGIALIVTLLAISMFSALGLALALSSAVDRMAAANQEDANALLNAADAALELAAHDLGDVADWNTILAGTTRSTFVDGSPGGSRSVSEDTVIDITGLTNDLTCGRAAGCTDVNRMASTADRPWGANNPWWRPFLYGRLTATVTPRRLAAPYIIVWLGDDGGEVDGDVVIDGGGPAEEGRYIVRARAVAFGSGHGYRALEAELARVCDTSAAGEVCLPGIRVQSWRVVAAVP
jgi:type II secretory pathway pseudopilin PulG